MINLPLLQSLDVTGYGLYPGDDPEAPGLHIHFSPGLTLVLGANGLGKTTLVTMLYRLLTGPSDISALLERTDLGTASLEVTQLPGSTTQTFAQRVADNAARATARLVFEVGSEEVSVERSLRDLTLRSFSVGTSPPSQDEKQYQDLMVRLANVSTFGDWILLLRYIVFYFEDRRSLVWDPSAQRQLLRILFLEPNQAKHWTDREREILKVDSEMRNMRSVVNKQERNLANDESLAANEPDIREQLRVLEQHQGNDNQRLDEVNSGIADIQARHERALLQFLNLEQKRESQYRELERAHLLSVNARLPQHSDSARYILAQLLTDADCLLCGNNVPSAMESMKSRIRGLECIVCGSDLSPVGDQILTDSADERISSREEDLQATDAELEAARNILQESEGERARAITEVQVLQTAIAERSARLEMLLKRLPPEEGRLHERRREFASLRAQVEALRYDLDEKHMSFEQTITAANTTVEKQAGEVQTSFDDFAHRFLLEDCRLLWSPQRARLGQSGGRFYFPAFELELGGSDFNGTFRRNGPDFVSESQREFIDLSFRMALAKVATKRHVSSLVMDAPESSLDAVFVDRAAGVLGTFGRSEEGNRLLVTSNIVEGNLIPALLKKAADKGDRANRVVDLLALATSTVAVRRHRDEYHAARDRLLGEADALE